MKHYFIALALTLCCFGAAQGQILPAGMNPAQARQMAQSASGQQLVGYVKQAKGAGYSLNDVKSLLRAQGASMADIAQAEAVWNENSSTASTQISIDNPMLVSNFGNLSFSAASNNQRDSSSRFGSAFFRSGQNGSEVPQLYIATPSDYQLGPGDELLISLYGASEESYIVQLNREGTIKVDRLAPIYLSGLSIEDAKARLISRFSEIYTGLKAADNDPSKVSLALSLQNARSVVVNITGQVNTPGTYTLSAFTSVINALYAAGGPNNAGSYRAVRLLRGGRIIKEIDLYDFFAGGKLTPLYLQDQDVLQVPAFEAQVQLKGAFKTPGYYELKKDETLADVLSYSGGFLSDGYKDRVFISRIMDFKRQSVTLAVAEGAMHLLKDGDVVEASLVQDVVENSVLLEGAAYIPGTYSLDSVSTIKDLLDVAGGLTREALKGQATLFRSDNGIERKALSIDLTDERQLNYRLADGDRLFIPQESKLFDIGTIRVEGEVNSPGIYDYKAGMSLSDALILAQGFTANANKSAVNVYRNFLVDGETYTQSETVAVNDDLSSKDQVLLIENSLIVVKPDPNFREVEKVYLSGLVLNEGSYAIKGNNYRLYDLLKDSGGFLKDAYPKGISVIRSITAQQGETAEAIQLALKEGVEASASQELSQQELNEKTDQVIEKFNQDDIVIGIDGDRLMASSGSSLRDNIVLQNGDRINVPKLDNTVTILGEVQKKSKVVYNDNITVKKAIRFAGGYNKTALQKRVYVIYKNGTIKPRRRLFGFITADPKLEPGATVIVPEKLIRENRTSIAEIVGITSSLATVALLIRQLGL